MDRYSLLYLLGLLTTLVQTDSYRFTRGGCDEGYVKCQDGVHCIPPEWICNGATGCFDGSDEKYCPYTWDETTTETPVTTSTQATTVERFITSTQPSPLTAMFSGQQEVLLFAVRVGVELKQLDSKTYLHAERLINQVLFEAQKGNLTSYTNLLHCRKYLYSFNQLQHPQNLQLPTNQPPSNTKTSRCADGSDEKYCPYSLDDTTADTPVTSSTQATTVQRIITSTQPSPTKSTIITTKSSGQQEVSLFALRVGVKLKQLDFKTYLQAERLISQVLFEAQKRNLTSFTNLLHCRKYLRRPHNLQLCTRQPPQ